ncbi:MAG: helix-turn-helix transcriptional regulator [Erysipelotrichaceae bacterium]|nr:helix-turn-helix transcriptional regulator [Erysipelotrichaceae bacterium]MBQ9987288.1 helix-turn-helix transcriptional regulator [Erysipelotrichales bacterium]MBR3693800.1 helix-turn-helix transcriptional regulator [Erysipelotrichales bacterium]
MVPRNNTLLLAVVSFVIWLLLVILFIAFMVLVVRALLKYLRGNEKHHENTILKKSLGEVIKVHRTQCNMTQEFVAEYMGVTRQTISKWETGINEPSTSNLLRLAKLFHVPAEDLLKEIKA